MKQSYGDRLLGCRLVFLFGPQVFWIKNGVEVEPVMLSAHSCMRSNVGEMRRCLHVDKGGEEGHDTSTNSLGECSISSIEE